MLIGIDNEGRVFVAYEKGCPSGEKYSTDNWANVKKVCYVYGMLIGLKSDNTLCVAYNSEADRQLDATVLNYSDVVDVVASGPYLAVLHKDGTISMELVGSFTSTEEYVEKQK